MDCRYRIKRSGKYLSGTKANEKYTRNSVAPTMGDRHSHAEYSTIWGNEPADFERMTAANYIKVLMEEYRWGDKKPVKFTVEVVEMKNLTE